MMPHFGNIPDDFKMNQNPLGWIEPKDRTLGQHDAHAVAMATMPKFAMPQQHGDLPVGQKILLTDTWKHPGVIRQLGFAYPGVHQLTGSCVGAGGGNMLFTLNATDVLLRNDMESIVVPFWPLTYGRSRFYCGDRGQGEGSLGSTFAKACQQDGVIDATESTLPQFTNSDALVWGESVEMKWSDGSAIASTFLTESRNHIVQTASPLHSAQEVWDSIANGYPVTRAFGYFCNPGSDSIQGTGDNAVLMGKYDGNGGHQETWLGIYNHPTLGKLIWEQNQWGKKVYGIDPAGGPAGGVWQKFDDVDRMCKSGEAEVFSFSGFTGYPARNILSVLKERK